MDHVIYCDRVFPYRPAMLLSITDTIVSLSYLASMRILCGRCVPG